MRKRLQNISPDFPHDFGRLHREMLIGALGVHFKGFDIRHQILQIFQRRLFDILIIFFGNGGAGKNRDSENFSNPLYCGFKINVLLQWLNVHGRLRYPNIKFSEILQPKTNIFDQNRFKGVSVESFECNFSVFNQ